MDSSDLAEVQEIVVAAARHVLPGCGIPVGKTFEPTDNAEETRQLVVFMGFAGEVLRGTLVVVAPIELMRRAYPLSFQNTARWEFEVFDWSGEVANRLLARVRNGLSVRGVEIESSTPRVMLGEQLQVTRSLRSTVCSACFASGDSWIRVWFDAMGPENQTVLSAIRAEDATPPEGDVVLF